MMKIVYYLNWEIDPIRRLNETHEGVSFVRVDTLDEARRELADADAFVSSGRYYSRELADILRNSAPNLRWIQTIAVGLDPFKFHGIPDGVIMTNAAGLKGKTVGEHAFAILLGMLHQLPEMERRRQNRSWDDGSLRRTVVSVEGVKMLVLGYGSIGREIARKAKAFDMQVVAINRSGRGDGPADEVRPVSDLSSILPDCDVVMLCLPLSGETRHLIGATQLRSMKPSSVLVNVGRGLVVDQNALFEALDAKAIAGAALDVYEAEPLPEESPLWDLPNVVLSPHVGGAAGRTYEKFADFLSENVRRFQAGEDLLNVVTIESDKAPASAWSRADVRPV